MIWIIWLFVIVFDSVWNWVKIKSGHKIFHGLESVYRIAAAIVLGLAYGLHRADWKIQLMYLLGCFFSAWLLFNPLLNSMRRKPLDYLGDNILDRVESIHQTFVIWCKLVCTAAFIYAFYHTDLL